MHFDTTSVMFNPAKVEVYRQNYGENGLHQSGTGDLLEVVNWKAISFRQMNTRDLRRPTVTNSVMVGHCQMRFREFEVVAPGLEGSGDSCATGGC